MSRISFFLASVTILLSAASSHAADILWSGRYRVEGVGLFNTRLDDSKREKMYLLHHLVLGPRIIAADGVNIFSRFDIFNASTGYTNQVGQFMGNPPGGCTSGDGVVGDPAACNAAMSRTQKPDTIAVTELYLRWSPFEFGSFVAGRMPIQFGIGMQYNAGTGLFDHFLDTKDLVGYKFVFGNFFVLPMYGKVYEGTLNKDDDITDVMIHAQWDNPETDLSMGAIYEMRVASSDKNDTPVAAVNPNAPVAPAATAGWTGKQLGIFVKKRYAEVKVGVEAGFQSGNTGLTMNLGPEESIEGYGLAGEVSYQATGSRNTFDLKVGMATGDNPNTTDKYEGYIFNRNYDVALMMFNYYLGPDSATNNGVTGTRRLTGSAEGTVDTDAISNTLYLAPGFQRALSDQLNLRARLIYAMLNQAQIVGGSTALGTEFDAGLEWLPIDRMSVRLDMGVLAPGDAFSLAGTANKAAGYGVSTKAAISF